MFRRVLVANRGEIARRVMRTCQRLGIETVAVHSDADADEPHVREADQAVRLGPAPARESYLDVERVLAAAASSGADAIHPGYGFLSENAAFARACRDAGVVFVGPEADTIELMGDKAAAKRRLEAAGVPVVPGVLDENLDDAALAEAAREMGLPVLVKAVAGGGGKGMRAVHTTGELADALAGARRESEGAFGDGRLILERLVARPRHVEIQVFGDAHGHVVHLNERECSIQRRHQKIVEEAPSPAVDAELRARMGAAAVDAAKAVDYLGAGTIEFLLAEDGAFYFLEMNTRLQVEHPVTELITGLDLVELQLRVAAGEPLGIGQDDVARDGHALEVRLYAEDVAAGFLPQTGTVHRFVVPEPADDVRIDAGIADGSVVSRHYDPMLAKLVVHGADRTASIDRMRWLLGHTAVLGVTTNLELLYGIVDHPVFASGELDTGFVAEHLADWQPQPLPAGLLVAAAVGLQRHIETDASPVDDPHSPWATLGPWRAGQVGGWHLALATGDETHDLVVTGRGGAYRIADDDTTHRVTVTGSDGDVLHLDHDGRDVTATVVVVTDPDAPPGPARRVDHLWVAVGGVSRRLDVVAPTRHAAAGLAAGVAAFTSPMPGAVIALPVAAGSHVAAGTTLALVEAMKMEHPVVAPGPGTLTVLHVAEGDAVDSGTVLLEFEPDDPGTEEASP